MRKLFSFLLVLTAACLCFSEDDFPQRENYPADSSFYFENDYIAGYADFFTGESFCDDFCVSSNKEDKKYTYIHTAAGEDATFIAGVLPDGDTGYYIITVLSIKYSSGSTFTTSYRAKKGSIIPFYIYKRQSDGSILYDGKVLIVADIDDNYVSFFDTSRGSIRK